MAQSHHKPDPTLREAARARTDLSVPDQAALSACPAWLDPEWPQALARIPLDLDAGAREHKALERKREIRSAGDLLRLIFAYSVCDWSLRLVGAWATILGIAAVSAPDLLQRFRKARPWLEHLLGDWLALRRAQALSTQDQDLNLTFCDGSSISHPGSTGTDWRLHLRFNLREARVTEARVTDVHGGESLRQFELTRGDLVVGDRAYARRPALGEALAGGAHILVRAITTRVLPLERATRRAFQLLPWLRRHARCDHPVEIGLWLNTACGRFAVRVIAQRLPRTALQRVQQRVRRNAQRRQRGAPSRTSCELARYIVVVTSLPAATWSAEAVLELYRVRWQIELLVKRLKSLLQVDALRAFDADLAATYLLGKLLAAALLDEWPSLDTPVAEWLAAWSLDEQRPLSLWRLTQLGFEVLRQAVRGPLTWARCAAAWPNLRRYLCDTPRQRVQQLAAARHWFQALGLPPLPAGDTSLD